MSEGETGVNNGGKKNNTKYRLNRYHVMLGCLIEAVQKKTFLLRSTEIKTTSNGSPNFHLHLAPSAFAKKFKSSLPLPYDPLADTTCV
jgi:hypothetical protein